MRRAVNIIIILVVYFGILYMRDIENHTAQISKHKTKITQKQRKDLTEDLY